MAMNHPDNDLLIRYLLHEVSAAEAASVEAWIHADEQHRRELETFEKVWRLSKFRDDTGKIDVQQEWEKLHQRIGLRGGEQPQRVITGERENAVRGKWYTWRMAVAVAASLFVVLLLGWKFFAGDKIEKPGVVKLENKPKDSAVAVLRHEVNNSGKPKRVKLQDGTVIILEDKSELRFMEPFDADKRVVSLVGKANFRVAKDKNRPFTVYSDALATTVLGTVFDVTAYRQENILTIRLYEGKVVVKAAASGTKRLEKAVYLSPGYELLYNRQTAVASIRKFSPDQLPPPDPESPETAAINTDNPNIPRKSGSWYMFNNQPLVQVLNQLREMYKTEIIYEQKELQKLYFIGQFNKADSLEVILSQIAKANDLHLTKTNDTFIIRK